MFVVGAGVSKNARLPLFGKLAERIYTRVGQGVPGTPHSIATSAEDDAYAARQYDRLGAAKEHWLKQQERGYLDADGEIGADCVSDPDLKRWIEDNAVLTTCSFCGREDEDAIAAEMDEFVGAVLDGIRVDWNHPDAEGIAYESAEGGYQADLIDTYEVLEHCGVSDEEDVIQAIVESMETDAWVAR